MFVGLLEGHAGDVGLDVYQQLPGVHQLAALDHLPWVGQPQRVEVDPFGEAQKVVELTVVAGARGRRDDGGGGAICGSI